MKRILQWFVRDEALHLQRQSNRYSRSELRWTRIGVVASLLLGAPTLVLTWLMFQDENSTADAPGPSDSPASTIPAVATLEQRVASLQTGVNVETFIEQFGSPLRTRTITQEFVTDDTIKERVWLVDRALWVQAITDGDDTVWFFGVVSCDDNITPTFDPTTTQREVTLRATRFSDVAPITDVYLDYVQGASFPGYAFEAIPGGSHATTFREAVWGMYPACDPSQEDLLSPLFDVFAETSGLLQGMGADVTSAHPSVEAARNGLVVNFYGEFVTDFARYESGMPAVRPHPGEAQADSRSLFGPLTQFMGPDLVLVERLMVPKS